METDLIQNQSAEEPGQVKPEVTDPTGVVVFDTSSGISLEEQQEILAGINAMAGGTHLVSEAAVKAKKRGFFFPLMVNIGALVLLGLGFTLLFLLHGQDQQGIRESSATLGLTERKLIQEIRQETNRQLSEKENEINDILSKLSAADAEFQHLSDSVESLTEEQKERAAYLMELQEEYHNTLSGLNDEKSRIIEDSRLRETRLRREAEERARELSSQIEQGQADLTVAIEELRRLSTEQEMAARAESQLSGFYASVNAQISAGRLDEASGTLKAMGSFLAAPLFRGVRSLESRRQTHLAAIAAMEAAVADAAASKREAEASRNGTVQVRSDPSAGSAAAGAAADLAAAELALAELQERYDAMEQRSSDQERAIAAYRSQGSEQSSLIAGFETAVDELRTANNNQLETLNRRDTEIVALRNENAAKDQQALELNNNINNLRTQIQAANSRVEVSEANLAVQRSENVMLQAVNEDLQRQINILQQQIDAAREAARLLLEN